MNMSSNTRRHGFGRLKHDSLIAALIFLTTLLIFWFSPVYQVTDSKYSMMVTESLLKHHTFALDNYAVPRLAPVEREDYTMDGDIYQLELTRGRIFYFFPPGSSVLSLPYVALMNAFGISAVNADGTYSHLGEMRIETSLAAILMAALAALFFYTSRLVLPLSWSVIIAQGGALGTQVWSTASRALWSHTWLILLLGVVVYQLLAQEACKRRMNPVLMASLLSWMYFVRPSASVTIIALSIYLLLYHRKLFIPYAATGAVWFAGLAFYSWHNFGHLLPSYYRANRLRLWWFKVALPGNLISPARGLLIYVPVLLFVGFLLVRYRRSVATPRLMWLALLIVAGNMIVISLFPHWWGGAGFGPRFSTDIVPWFVLLAILGVQAMLSWRAEHRSETSRLKWSAQLATGAILLACSIFINARGATAAQTWLWNTQPTDPDTMHVDVAGMERKLWDWRQPQFLAGLVPPSPPEIFPTLESRIDFKSKEANKYVWYGWSGPEENGRWTDGTEAALVFTLNEVKDMTLQIRLGPALTPGKVLQQRMYVVLNGQQIDALLFNEPKAYEFSVLLPKNVLQQKNSLIFKLPDAVSPSSMKLGDDQRVLGVSVEWMQFETQPAGQ